MKYTIAFTVLLAASSPSFEGNPTGVSDLPMSERQALCQEVVSYSEQVECDDQQPSMFDLDECLQELEYLSPCVESRDVLACAKQTCEDSQPACVRVYEATCSEPMDPKPPKPQDPDPKDPDPRDPNAPVACTCDTVDPFPDDPARATFRFCADFSCGSSKRCLWDNKSEEGSCETPCRESEFPNQGSCATGQICDARPAANISNPEAGDLHYVCQ